MNISTCGMCGSSLGRSPMTKIDKIYCGFCEMFVKPSVDGERMERFKRLDFISHDSLKIPTPALMETHTKSLLELLRFMRDERRSYFDTMRVLKKGASEDPSFKEGERMSAEMYETITKKCFVVENILRDRMGYIPKKITDNLLLKYEERCNDPYNERVMSIRRPEREKEPVMERGITR